MQDVPFATPSLLLVTNWNTSPVKDYAIHTTSEWYESHCTWQEQWCTASGDEGSRGSTAL